MKLCPIILTAFFLMFAVPAVNPESAGEQRKTRILLIYHKPDHPPMTHMYRQVCGLLAKCLNQTKGVDAYTSDGWPQDPEMLRGVKAIVFYTSPGGNILLDESHRAQAEKLMRDGVGLVAIHWATDAKKELGSAYQSLLGGWFNTDFSKLDTTTARLTQVDPKHPYSRGWQDYDLREEYYLDLKFEPGSRPLLKANVKGKEQIVAWSFERPESKKGRSFGTTLGHFYDNFKIDAFRRAIVNGILWTAHKDPPRKGAPVALADSDFPTD